MGNNAGPSKKERRKIVIDTVVSPFFLEDEAARFLRMLPRTLQLHRLQKTGPIYRRHGGTICYHLDDLRGWSIENNETHT